MKSRIADSLPPSTVGYLAPLVGATGNPTTLAETVFSTIPGSPVYASKASQYTRDGTGHGIPHLR